MSTFTPIQSQDQEIQLTRDSTPLTTEKSSDKKIKIVQKGKYNQKKYHSRFTSSPIVKKNVETSQKKKGRKDFYGTVICKSNKRKVHLVFIDEISDRSLTDIVEIESVKKFNVVPFIKGGKDIYIKSNTCCSCFIF